MTVINDLFYQLLEHKEISLQLSSREYESMRVQLTRKLTRYKDEMGKCGFLSDFIANCSLKAVFSGEGVATYKLGAKRQQKQYTILSVGSGHDSQTTNLRTDLAVDQESTDWYLGTSEDPQIDAADTDTGGEEREDNGRGTDAEDWRAHAGSIGDGD